MCVYLFYLSSPLHFFFLFASARGQSANHPQMTAAAEIEKDVWQYWSDNRLGNDSIRKIEGWDLLSDQLCSLCNMTLEGEVQSGPGTYVVSMRTGTQVNKGTGYQRKVRRVVWEWKKADGQWGGVYTCADALKLEQAFGARVQVLST